jgi:RNA polymerase sigma-70 factor (ECF subfamily)
VSSDFYHNEILPFAPIIIKICRAYTTNESDFEDYYQEVCLQVWRSRNSFKQQAQWSTWVYRIALNVCLTLHRKDKKRGNRTSELEQLEHHDPNHAFNDESLNLLYAAIRKLEEVDRAIILLYLEEKSYREIAEIMGATTNNIGVRINRIKNKLKKLLDGKVDRTSMA